MWTTLEFSYKKAPKLKSSQRTMSKHGSYLTSGALLLFLGFSYLITYSMYAFIHSFASLHFLYLEHLADSATFFFFQISVGNRGFTPALQHPALPGVSHSTSTKETNIVLSCFQFLQLLCSQVMTLVSPLICHPLFIRGYLSVGFFPFYCWPVFTSSLTLLTLASTWQLNTLHYSVTFAIRTDMELIAAFLYPIYEVTWNCPCLNPARFPIGGSPFLWIFYLICLYRSVWM